MQGDRGLFNKFQRFAQISQNTVEKFVARKTLKGWQDKAQAFLLRRVRGMPPVLTRTAYFRLRLMECRKVFKFDGGLNQAAASNIEVCPRRGSGAIGKPPRQGGLLFFGHYKVSSVKLRTTSYIGAPGSRSALRIIIPAASQRERKRCAL